MSGAATAAVSASTGSPARRRSLGALIFSHSGAAVGYALAAILLAAGWANRASNPIRAEDGLGYALGIVGGSLMLILLLYSLRKRVRWLRNFGATRYWFRIHMMLGVVGPLLILYHCNFNVGSLNSQVALYCTLLVAGSGIVGRYLYAKIHQGLYGRKASLRQLTENLRASGEKLTDGAGLIADVRHRLVALGDEIMTPPGSMTQSVLRPLSIGLRTRWLYHQLSWQMRRELTARALTSPAVAQHRDRLLTTGKGFLALHLANVRRVTQFGLYERLFSLWHIIHVPFFLMMVLSGIVHVLAVHMY